MMRALRLLLVLGMILTGCVAAPAAPVALAPILPALANPITGPAVVITLLVVVPTALIVSAIIGEAPAQVVVEEGQRVMNIITALTFPASHELKDVLTGITQDQYDHIVNHPQRVIHEGYQATGTGNLFLAIGVPNDVLVRNIWVIFRLNLEEDQTGTSVLRPTGLHGVYTGPDDLVRTRFCLQFTIEPVAARGYNPRYEPIESGIVGAQGTCNQPGFH